MKVFAILSLLLGLSQAKVFERCELARELLDQGFSRSSLGDWVCLTFYESSWNTAATNYNTNGSTDYGLFEINDNYWCDASVGYGADCNVACSNLLDNNISDDCSCAKIIYNRHGFEAWYGWINNCKGENNESWVSDCGV